MIAHTTAMPGGIAAGAGHDALHHVTIIQGERGVSDDPRIVYTTVVGSSIAACLYDREAKLGGINHFLIGEPQPGVAIDPASQHRYGVHAMELLINEMLRHGARRERLRARLYGGSELQAGPRSVGGANAAFAVRFLLQDRIPLIVRDLGGPSARRVEFQPAYGRSAARPVRETLIPPPPRAAVTPVIASGELDLF